MKTKGRIWIYPIIILMIVVNACNSNDDLPEPESNNPFICLKTGTGLNDGGRIYFLALSKTINYNDLTTDEKFDYRKTNADWYIDGDIIPFQTEYKEFKKPTGEYYFMLNAAGVVITTTMTVLAGKQTVLISGSNFGTIDIDFIQP